MKLITDLVGKKYFNLLIIEDYWYVKYHIVKCLCECGNIMDIIYDNLQRGHTKGCGCLRNKLIGPSYKDITATYWSRVKYTANKRDIDFDIYMEDAWNVLEQQNYRCLFTDKLLFLTNRK